MKHNFNFKITQSILDSLNIDLENSSSGLILSISTEKGQDKITLEKTIDENNYFQVTFIVSSEDLKNLEVQMGTQVDEFNAQKVKTFSQKLSFLLSVLISNEYWNLFYEIHLLILNYEKINDLKDYSEAELDDWLESNYIGYSFAKKKKD